MEHNSILANPYGLTSQNQKLYNIQMLLIVETSGGQDKEFSQEWLVNTDPSLNQVHIRNDEHLLTLTMTIKNRKKWVRLFRAVF